jgi:hypothetical protein
MRVSFDNLTIGQTYDRPALVKLWDLGSYHAIGRGVVTPKGSNLIILFVTKEKQQCLTQYKDFLSDDLLYWEGEDGHGNDERIAHASKNEDEIHLFYRERHHSPFTYHGRIILTHYVRCTDKPSEFVFKVISLAPSIDKLYEETFSPDLVAEIQETDQAICSLAITEAGLNSIDKGVIVKSRGVGQRFFRGSLLKLWQGKCAVTGTQIPEILKASHIKPWRASDITEKLDPYNGLLLVPNLDTLMDTGLISFADNGEILISPKLPESDRTKLHVHKELHLLSVHPQSQAYLDFHRAQLFRA